MGFHVSLMLTSIENKQKFLERANLQEGEDEDKWNELPFSGVQHGDNWLVWMNWHKEMLDENNYANFFNSFSLLTCDLSEGSMFSACRSWDGGQVLWSIVHHGSDSGDYEINGELPAQAQEIIASKRKAQSEEIDNVDHLFDAPIDLFAALGGIRYDQNHELPFHALIKAEKVLQSNQPASPLQNAPWWKFW